MPGASRLTDVAQSSGPHCHGCPVGAHPVTGPAITGSPTVLADGLPVLRGGGMDIGVSAVCCGPNMWMTAGGSTTVLIDKMPAVRIGDPVQHCGFAPGTMMMGSTTVIIGG